jgi:hypothetical protein
LGVASKEFKGKTCAYCRRERASEAKEVGGFNINVVHVVCERCGRARTYRRDGLVARFIILCLCGTPLVGQAAPAKDEETLQGKLAEMVAFIRLARTLRWQFRGTVASWSKRTHLLRSHRRWFGPDRNMSQRQLLMSWEGCRLGMGSQGNIAAPPSSYPTSL